MTAIFFWGMFGGLFLAVAIADRLPTRTPARRPASSEEALAAIDREDTWLEEIEAEDQARARHGDSWAFGTKCGPILAGAVAPSTRTRP